MTRSAKVAIWEWTNSCNRKTEKLFYFLTLSFSKHDHSVSHITWGQEGSQFPDMIVVNSGIRTIV